jgi:diphosphomevalonate decarboxylase
MKATAIAPSNIAFIKYWGLKDSPLRLPTNGSISMNLSNLLTTTTVEFSQNFKEDEIIINNETSEKEAKRVIAHLDRIRSLAKISHKAKVVSVNNFPSRTGLSSSASGFAALTMAASAAAGLKLSEKELSILARHGSGSACRSIPDGFTEWVEGNSNDTSYAVSLFPSDYWDIVDIVAVVNVGPKDVPTSEGQKLALSSPFFPTRLAFINNKIKTIKKYLKEKNFPAFGELIESEALELHAIMLTSRPSLIYWLPGTISVMKQVQKWRKEEIQAYFTVNTGQDVHIICQKKDAEKVTVLIQKIPEVKEIITNSPSKGANIISEHLF